MMSSRSTKEEERKLRQRTVGELLRNARIKMGRTQLEMAKTLGYSSSQFVSNWERGEAMPPMDCFPKIATLLKIDTNELIDCIQRYQEEYLLIERRELQKLFKKHRNARR